MKKLPITFSIATHFILCSCAQCMINYANDWSDSAYDGFYQKKSYQYDRDRFEYSPSGSKGIPYDRNKFEYSSLESEDIPYDKDKFEYRPVILKSTRDRIAFAPTKIWDRVTYRINATRTCNEISESLAIFLSGITGNLSNKKLDKDFNDLVSDAEKSCSIVHRTFIDGHYKEDPSPNTFLEVKKRAVDSLNNLLNLIDEYLGGEIKEEDPAHPTIIGSIRRKSYNHLIFFVNSAEKLISSITNSKNARVLTNRALKKLSSFENEARSMLHNKLLFDGLEYYVYKLTEKIERIHPAYDVNYGKDGPSKKQNALDAIKDVEKFMRGKISHEKRN